MPPVTKVFRTRTFAYDGGVAVRLPRRFGVPVDTEVEISQSGNVVTFRLKPKRQAEAQSIET